jgi:hypothetical protein
LSYPFEPLDKGRSILLTVAEWTIWISDRTAEMAPLEMEGMTPVIHVRNTKLKECAMPNDKDGQKAYCIWLYPLLLYGCGAGGWTADGQGIT